MDETELWFGTLNGITIVYDPAIKVPGSRWVLLFAVIHQRLIPYRKAHARSVAKPLRDDDSRLAAAGAYESWRQSRSETTLSEASNDVHCKDALLAKKLEDIIHKHRRSLERESLTYRGVTEPDGRGYMRNSSCRACHRAIGSDTHLICNSCEWIVCSSCGTCGCQRRP